MIAIQVQLPGGRKSVLRLSRSETLLDAASLAWSDMAYFCQNGACGLCRLQVVDGAELLSPLTQEELGFFDDGELIVNWRLACMVHEQSWKG